MHIIEPADVQAIREGKPVVVLTRHDLLTILAGRAMNVGTLDGGEIAIRLYAPEEFLAAHVKACEKHGNEPSMTIGQATALVAPFDVDLLNR